MNDNGRQKMWPPDRIKALRKRYGETQQEFCERIGVDAWTLRKWEQGLRNPLGPAELLLDRLEEDIDGNGPRPLRNRAIAS
jgi:DNA-binding transcriptional regulator YiaG